MQNSEKVLKEDYRIELTRYRRQVRINYFIFIVFALLSGAIIGFSFKNWSSVFSLQQKDELDLSIMQTVYERVKAEYDGEIDKTKLVENSVKGLVAGLGDVHSSYMTAEETRQFNESLTGEIGGGIGAEIGIRDGNLTVVRPLKNNPAIQAGVEAGDVILKVDEETVVGQDLGTVVLKIRGAVGTSVKLTLARPGIDHPLEITIVRAIVDNPSVDLNYRDDVAVITIYRFDDKTAALAQKAVRDLKNRNAKAVILDLRDNTGGLLSAAQSVAGLWLDGSVVLTQKYHDKIVDTLFAPSGRSDLANLTTIVLINENSASASEILAAALREYDKAKLLGVKTYGKGSVQQLVKMPIGGQLKLTIGHWFTPQDKTIERVGIEPDFQVDRSQDDIKNDRDPQLDKALELLK